MGESNGAWGSAPTDTHADEWDRLPYLPEAGEDKLFDAFCESKGLTREDLVRIGTRWASRDGHAHLVWLFPDGFKYRRLHDGKRTSEEGVTWKHFKRIGTTGHTEAIIAEGETDGATLARYLPHLDVLIMPNGAKNISDEMIALASTYSKVYVGTDNDEAGNEGAGKFLTVLDNAERVLPPEGKDWNEAASVGAVGENFDISGVVTLGLPSLLRWPSRVPTTIDFDTPPPPPEWIVEGLIEAGTITIVSADTGAGKSIITNALLYSILSHNKWLNRDTNYVPIVLLDGENPRQLIVKRLRALGVTNALAKDLIVYNRIGCELGKQDWNEWLQAVVKERSAGLVVVDTVGACTTAEVNNNDAVLRLYNNALRPIADAGTAVLLLHHERKDRLGEQRMPGQAMMGARQWAGQADTHLVLTRTSDPEWDDLVCTRTTMVTMEVPKTRDGEHFKKEALKMWSQFAPDTNDLLDLRVTSEGPAPEKETEFQRVATEMRDALRKAKRTLSSAELKREVGFARSETLWTSAREYAVANLGIRADRIGNGYAFQIEPEIPL